MKTRYHIIKNFNELKELVKSCKKTGYASVDFETNARGLYMDDFRPTILSVSFQAGSGVSIPLLHFDKSVQFLRKDNQWLKWLLYFGRKVIENPDIVKIAWNWKFDNQIFQKYGIYSRGTVIDGMLAKYLLDETRPNDLKSMVRRFLPEFANYEKYDSFGSISWDKKPLEELCRYGCMDTDFTLRLGIFFESKLIYKNFYNLYRNLLMSASRVLQSAEKFGLPFDKELNGKLIKKYADQIETYETNLRSIRQVRIYEKYTLKKRKEDYINSLYEEIDNLREQEKKEGKNVSRSIKNREDKISRLMAGEFSTKSEMKLLEPINFKSQKQMVDFLFLSKKGLKLPIIEYTKDPKTKKETTNPSTSEDVLLKLKEHDSTGFINNLLDLRGIQTINSTFIVGLGELVQDDGCVHPTFLLHGCISGNTKLVCKENDIRIKDICPKEKGILNIEDKNLWVLSHENTWEQITHAINKGKQPLYKITTTNGDTLRCTKEHKLLTTKGWKKVSDIIKNELNIIMYDTHKFNITKPIVGKPSSEVIFKDIPGFPGYLASSEGDIYSVKVPGLRGVLDYNHPHKMVPREWKKGRLRIYLRNNTNKKYAFSVSHLIWMSFNNVNEIPDGMVIDHINCNTLNNRPENLQCITYPENIKRSYKYTRSSFISGSRNGSNKFTTETVGKILEDHNMGFSQKEICNKYNISQKQVSGIILKQRRKEIYLSKISDIKFIGKRYIYDLSVNNKHSYITRSNFINSNTSSGRLSSRNPNGQNIPKTMVNPDVKLQFITPKGKLFLTYDYSQAELRILAHLAKEKTMLEWFKTGKDIHLASACKKYHEDYDKIIKIYSDELHPEYKLWKKRRKQAKTINFGIVYEQSAPKLAESLSTPEESVSINEAQEFLEDYFKTFPRIKKYMEKQHNYMESHGYCVSLFGRKRRCPQVYSENYGEYLEALRQSTNMPCQSAASDMALFASVIVYEKVKKGELPPMIEVDTVHDSVYQFIEPKYITPDTIYKIWDICRNPSTKKYFGFSIDDVDMYMDFSIGRNMAEELPFIPGYDYNKLLSPDWDEKEYYEEFNQYRDIPIKKYPEKFKEYFNTSWKQR